MTDRDMVTVAVLAIVTAFVVGILTAGWSIYGPTRELSDRMTETTEGTIPPVELVKGDDK